MKILTLLSLLFVAQTGFAANPDQDLIVDMVRERFAASRTPTMAEMQPGKTWNCVIYSGQRGIMPNYNTIRPNFVFETSAVANQLVNQQDFPYTTFDITSTAVTSKSEEGTLYARVARNGALVFENVSTQPKHHKAYRSIANDKLRAIDYVYCK